MGTTLCGYTDYTKGNDPLATLEKVLKAVKIPVIGEGNLDTPEKAKKAVEMGALAVVVGGAITRPKQIAEKFVKAIETI
nr:tRNA-dihydrouridine synthase [uncultured Brachyspira sp.]